MVQAIFWGCFVILYLIASGWVFFSQMGYKSRPDPWWLYIFMPGIAVLVAIALPIIRIINGEWKFK